MRLRRSFPASMRHALLFVAALWIFGQESSFAAAAFPLSSNDVVAFVGGADVSAAQEGGHLETLLTCAYPSARFRNFGWEGDTVYSQPRDIGFPPLADHLRKASATVIVLQFGRAEALGNETRDFKSAYRALIQQFQAITPRLVLVAPPPFENGGGSLPNLARRNGQLAGYVGAIGELAAESHLTFIEYFTAINRSERLTDDGLQLTPRGQALCAVAFGTQIGLGECMAGAGPPNPDGSWPNPRFEELRKAIVRKNRYWFNYWRPQNWAFLGGDRTEQPSSRDHRDPKIRWFPKEMEEFRGLIETQENIISDLANEGLTPDSHRHKGENK